MLVRTNEAEAAAAARIGAGQAVRRRAELMGTGYKMTLSALTAARSGREGPLQFPPPPTPEGPSRPHSRIFAASMVFAVNRPARRSLRCLTTRQASLPLRTAQLLPLKGF